MPTCSASVSLASPGCMSRYRAVPRASAFRVSSGVAPSMRTGRGVQSLDRRMSRPSSSEREMEPGHGDASERAQRDTERAGCYACNPSNRGRNSHTNQLWWTTWWQSWRPDGRTRSLTATGLRIRIRSLAVQHTCRGKWQPRRDPGHDMSPASQHWGARLRSAWWVARLPAQHATARAEAADPIATACPFAPSALVLGKAYLWTRENLSSTGISDKRNGYGAKTRYSLDSRDFAEGDEGGRGDDVTGPENLIAQAERGGSMRFLLEHLRLV